MTIARVIIIKTPEQKFSDAERIWKSQCAPLMRRQKGCRMEKFMRSTERPDLYISYSEWDSVADIEKYRATAEHGTIQSEVRALQGSRAVVWTYEVLE
ncbi:MAG: Antibiotic biosynthesis monooxygenase [Pseudomonadota bacterium]|jgi:heme-degrading monooxygenase HmoA